VGLATARGLAVARNIPVIGLTTGEVLAAMARAHTRDSSIVSVIDTKRGDVYLEAFTAGGEACNEAVSLAADAAPAWLEAHGLADAVLLGDGVPNIIVPESARVLKDMVFPAPAVMAALAAIKPVTGEQPVPLYVRPPDVTLPKP
jgi:tRNA threonylcarbamoyladenosine biosynthesis protein TsaB